MQPYDFLMIAILVGLTLHGFAKGMAWQVAYLASLIASYFVAKQFAEQLAPMFGQSAPFNKFVAMLVIYIATSFAIWMLFRVVHRAIDKVKMEGFDHQMGALIGFARGALWCIGVTFFAVTLLPDNLKVRIIETKSGRTIAMMLDKAHTVFPPEVHEVVGPVLHRIEQRINPQEQPSGGQSWPAQGAQPFPGQPYQPQPANAWPTNGQANGQANTWPNPSPSGNAGLPQQNTSGTAWPRPNPGGTPVQPAAWPNPNP